MRNEAVFGIFFMYSIQLRKMKPNIKKMNTKTIDLLFY